MNMRYQFASAALLFILFLPACALFRPKYLSEETYRHDILTDETLRLNASAGPLAVHQALLITDNDTAYERKLDLIRRAKETIDLAYFIYSNDFSSSLLTSELLAAVKRGVRVRLLLDYHENYQRLDLFSMMERYSKGGTGSLEVRFYNRPTDNIIRDAAYLTLGCGDVGAERSYSQCEEDKYELIESQFEAYREKYGPDDSAVPSNFNTGGSGLFLSGLYTKDIDIMARAVLDGARFPSSEAVAEQEGDVQVKTDEQRQESLRKGIEAARLFWQARSTNDKTLQRMLASLKLDLAFVFYGKTIRPLYERFSAYFPLNRPENSEQALTDWEFLTQFLHHKLLLVDGQYLIIGGRNVEDSYHMLKNDLTPYYVFHDTDLFVDLAEKSPALSWTFDNLWNYRQMTASLADVREHAPNDLVTATRKAHEVCEKCGSPDGGCRACIEANLTQGLDHEAREREEHDLMQERAARYLKDYRPAMMGSRTPRFPIDPEAKLYYLENFPFERPDFGDAPDERLFQPRNGHEGESGKYIHQVWLASLRNTCRLARESGPQQVILNNAYFFPPANLLRAFAQMVDGTMDCPNVRIVVLTNSPETTDLSMVNLAARYSLKAFADYMSRRRDAKRGATLRYFELKRQGVNLDRSDISLHSKVALFGPDIFVGSANADVRSYVLDTNNGMLIRNAPRLRQLYADWFYESIGDLMRINDKTRFFMQVSREDLLKQDAEIIGKTIRGLLETEAADKRVLPEPFVEVIVELLSRIYDLSTEIMQGKARQGGADQEFDALFKLL